MSLLSDALATATGDLATFHAFTRGAENQQVTTDGGPIPTLANLVKNITNKVASALKATSTSMVAVLEGERTFNVGPGKSFTPDEWVTIVGENAYMSGTVVSYTGSVLVVNVVRAIGTGTYSAWTIALSGIPGIAGTGGSGGSDPDEVLITKFPWEN